MNEMTATPAMPAQSMAADCPLCVAPAEAPLWDDGFCRVIAVDDADHPGFCRVILNRHVREMSDLAEAEQMRLMRVVFAVEKVLRQCTDADKINLASFGNMVAHVHWHVIPRWRDDRRFPEAIWAAALRPTAPARKALTRERLRAAIINELGDDLREPRP
ncbi:HIT family protein [Rhodocyclus tenuis]|uniref:HIT family protein n=1 Tax=Rhodocyclus tenuis TaxID=1066 RepID=UPI001F5BF27F|nr:HIT family protein [Rhodocyclus tenuis]